MWHKQWTRIQDERQTISSAVGVREWHSFDSHRSPRSRYSEKNKMIEVGAAENSQNKHGGPTSRGGAWRREGRGGQAAAFSGYPKSCASLVQPRKGYWLKEFLHHLQSPKCHWLKNVPHHTQVQCNVRACFRHAHIQHNMHMSTHNLYGQIMLTYVQLACLSPTHRCVYTYTRNVFLLNIQAILMNTHDIDLQTRAHREWRMEVEFWYLRYKNKCLDKMNWEWNCHQISYYWISRLKNERNCFVYCDLIVVILKRWH